MNWKKIIKWAIGTALGGAGVALTFNYYSQKGQINVVGNESNNQVASTPIWRDQTFESADASGRKAHFVISILGDEIWELGKDSLLDGHRNFDTEFPLVLEKAQVLHRCKELIAIGVASEEGKDPGLEVARASKRADRIMIALRNMDRATNFYKLNLGQYRGVNANGLSLERRRVIVGGILDRDENMSVEDIKFALYKGLAENMNTALGVEMSNYSDFIFTNPGTFDLPSAH